VASVAVRILAAVPELALVILVDELLAKPLALLHAGPVPNQTRTLDIKKLGYELRTNKVTHCSAFQFHGFALVSMRILIQLFISMQIQIFGTGTEKDLSQLTKNLIIPNLTNTVFTNLSAEI
jgi:hypothetical protein